MRHLTSKEARASRFATVRISFPPKREAFRRWQELQTHVKRSGSSKNRVGHMQIRTSSEANQPAKDWSQTSLNDATEDLYRFWPPQNLAAALHHAGFRGANNGNIVIRFDLQAWGANVLSSLYLSSTLGRRRYYPH